MQDQHLTYRPRYAVNAVLAMVVAAVLLLLPASARAEDPLGSAAVAQQALEQVHRTLDAAPASSGEAPSTAPVASGGGAASPATGQAPAPQQAPASVPAGGGGSPEGQAPATGAIVSARPAVVGEVEKTAEPIVRSGQTAARETAATLKRTQADAESLVNARTGAPTADAAAKGRDLGAAQAPRATSTSAAPARRSDGVAVTAPTASLASSADTRIDRQADGVVARLGTSELTARARSEAAAGTAAAPPAQRTEPGGSASASAGTGIAAAAVLLAMWMLMGAAFRTRLLSSPATSPALGFTSLLERPG